MFNLKTALKGAAAGFVISFIAGIIGRVDFLIILLRGFLSAVFSGALFGGLGVLYNLFLGGTGGSDIDLSAGVAKTSPSGSVVDITLTDEDLPDSDTAPDFTIAPNIRLFDTPSGVSGNSELAEPAEVLSADASVSQTAVQPALKPVEQPLVKPAEQSSAKAEVFEPIALGEKAPAAASGSQMSEVSDIPEVSAETDDVEAAESAQVSSESSPHEQEGGTLIDNLPDMEGFSDDKGYVEENNDDTFGAVTPHGALSSASAPESPVDISDAKNIADAIRTALKEES